MHDKKYLVKVYKGDVFQGVLPYPVDDVQYSQDINSAGCEITIKLAVDLKKAGITTDVDYLITNTGNHITDNNGNRIVLRKDYFFATVPVDLGNQIEVWLYYSGAPNGKRVFSGLISKWKESSSDATITVTALSYGVQLDNYLIKVLPGHDLIRLAKWDSSDNVYVSSKGSVNNRNIAAAQTFIVATATTISQAAFGLHRPTGLQFSYQATLSLYLGAPGTSQTLLATASAVVTQTTSHAQSFVFSAPINLTPGNIYTLQVTTDGATDFSLLIDRDSTGTYADGTAYLLNDSSGWFQPGGDYAFSVTTASGSIGNQFLSTDPTYILTSLMDSMLNQGGKLAYDPTTIDITNTAVSYIFKANTILDGVKKCLELAPAGWYWYVDVGANLIHFHKFKLTSDFTLIKGLNIGDLDVEYSLEQIKNSVLFTGGANPANTAVNITSVQNNTPSIGKYGQWLDYESDSRVTRQDTADLLSSNIIGEFSKPIFTATATILASQFDIENLQIGKMVAFENTNDLTNSLILQIVSISRTPDTAKVTFSQLPPTQTHRIEDIRRNLDNLITADNPAS